MFDTYPNITVEWRPIDDFAGIAGARHVFLVYRPSADYFTWRVIRGGPSAPAPSTGPYGLMTGQIDILLSQSADNYASNTNPNDYGARILVEGVAAEVAWGRMVESAQRINNVFEYNPFTTTPNVTTPETLNSNSWATTVLHYSGFNIEGNEPLGISVGPDFAPGLYTILGSGENDTFAPSGTKRIYFGGAGEDWLLGGNYSGSVGFFGGADDDYLQASLNSGGSIYHGGDGSIDNPFGNEADGFDTLDFSSRQDAPIYAQLFSNNQSVVWKGLADVIYSIEGIIGTPLNDSFWIGPSRTRMIDGGDGIDVVLANASTTISGMVIDLSGGNDGLKLTNIEWAYGSMNNDTLIGSVVSNKLFGGSGNDNLVGGEGSDELYGGLGDDNLAITIEDSVIDGGFGYDTLDLTSLVGPLQWVNINSGNDLGELLDTEVGGIEKIIGTNDDDLFTLTINSVLPDGNLDIDGGGGDDQIIGNDSANTFWGGTGDDFLDGGSDNDTLRGGDGDDIIVGGAENYLIAFDKDLIFGGAGDDNILGGDDNDTIHGEGDDDIVLGGQGSDSIYGGSGNDRLIGGDDDDSVYGGAGDDLVFGSSGSDVVSGGSGNDKVFGGFNESTPTNFDSFEDGESDQLIGGTGADIFIANNRDNIQDIDGSDFGVFFGNLLLRGGDRQGEAAEAPYIGKSGEYYSLTGSSLTVISGSSQITIASFRNGNAGIVLRDEEPDVDNAERRRDPLIIDLNGDGLVATSLNSSSTYFDLNSDGFAERVAWARSTDALLALDKNGDGVVNDGGELFGSGYVEAQGGIPVRHGSEGFADLRQYDLNNDSLIDGGDAVFSSLRLWVDADSDGQSSVSELKTLGELGIASISLKFGKGPSRDVFDDGSYIGTSAVVKRTDGTSTQVYDAYLAVDSYDSREIVDGVIPQSIADLPFLIGRGTVSDLDVAMSRDPALEEMVRAFADLQVGDARQILERVEQIILRWTGADEVEADSRGGGTNGRWLFALEKLVGNGFFQAQVNSSNPRNDAATLLNREWQKFLLTTTAQLLGQTELGGILTPGLSYKAGAFFVVEDGGTLESQLQAIASNAPTELSAALSYWHAMLNIVAEYAVDLSVTSAEIDAAVAPFLSAAGIPYSPIQIRNAFFGGAASGDLVGTGWSAFNVDEINDLLIAGDGVTELRGSAGQDIFVVSKSNGKIVIDDSSSDNILHLTDILQADINLSFGIFEGRPQITVRSNDAAFEAGIGADVIGKQFRTDISSIRFADGTLVSVKQLLGDVAIAYGTGQLIIGAAGTGSTLNGTSGDDFIVGNGTSDIYNFGPASGSDIITDNNVGLGGTDRLLIDAPQGSVHFSVSDDGIGSDVIVTIDGSTSRLTLVGQRGGAGQQIEQFEFSDGAVLTRSQLDTYLNTGTSGDNLIYGTQSEDNINGLAGDDLLRGNKGADNYRFDWGWGNDRIVDGDTGNAVVFGAGIALEDIIFERGGLDKGDLVAIHSVTGDRVTIVNGLQRAVIGGFLFDDNRSLTLPTVISNISLTLSSALVGSDFDDRLIGTVNDERFVGQSGNDYLEGNGGIDSYQFSSGYDTVVGSDSGIDTLLAPVGARFSDFLLFQNPTMQIGFKGFEGITTIYESLEFVRFDNGDVVSVSYGANTAGSEADDLLSNVLFQDATFLPGGGNDSMFGGRRNDSYVLESGFGRDVIFDVSGSYDTVTINGSDHAYVNAMFRREDTDLVISFSMSSDELRINSYFWNFPYAPESLFDGERAGLIEAISFGADAGNETLGAAAILSLISSKTSGDDWVMTGIRDGGAGNDVLVGGGRAETYVFAAGYGNDIVKDSSRYDGGSEYNDTLVFSDLASTDVAITRNADDPFSVIFTIIATGETLTIDGTPDDGLATKFYETLRYSWSNQPRVGVTIEQFQFTDGIFDRLAIENWALAASGTDGVDEIWGLNSDGTINGGLGDDLIRLVGGNETIIFSADGGHDVVSVEVTGKYGFQISLDGISLQDIDFIPVDDVNGIKGKHVRIESANGGSLTVLHGRDIDKYPYYIEGGYNSPFTIDGLEYSGQVGKAVPTSNIGTAQSESLQLPRSWDYDDDGNQIFNTADDIFDPLEGNDRIFGDGGTDTVIFGRGYGTDKYFGNIGRLISFGEATNADPRAQSGVLHVQMADDITRNDIAINWLTDQPGYVELLIVGTADRLIFLADLLGKITFADGTLVNSGTLQTEYFVAPMETAPRLTAIDERVVAMGGSIEVAFEAHAGRDTLEDQRFNAHVEGNDDLGGWEANTVILRGGAILDDFEFIRDAENTSNLIIRNINSGAEFIVKNQFALGGPVAPPAWRPVDQNGDGTADWSAIDFDHNGVADFARLDTNGDGVPNWLNPDFDQDGQSDWQISRVATLDSDANGYDDAYAYDDDSNGTIDEYIAINGGNYVYLRDTNGDGVPEEYSVDRDNWTAIPLTGQGNPDWSAIDTDSDGIADLGDLDANGDSVPEWIPNGQGTGQVGPWNIEEYAELYDLDGNFVASRNVRGAAGAASFFVAGNGNGGLIARDTDGDNVPDEYGVDINDNGVPDPGQPEWPRQVVGQFVLETATGAQSYDWADIAPRLVMQAIEPKPPTTSFNIYDFLPAATVGDDALLVRADTQIDSLAGNDEIISIEGGSTLLFGAGDGNDVLRAATERVQREGETYLGDSVRFEGIIDPGQLLFLRGGNGLADLIVQIRATGETLRIEEQFGPSTDLASPFQSNVSYAPIVTSFILDGGLSLDWSQVLRLVEGEDFGGSNVVSSDEAGGVLDGGAGQDSLNGSVGDDIYVFGRAYDEDTIRDSGGNDVVQFGPGIQPSDIFFSRTSADGGNLLVEVLGVERLTLTISGQFSSLANRIETFAFDDGTIWSWSDVQSFILNNASTNADDDILGFITADIISGRGGNDRLTGAGGDDQLFGGAGRDTAIFSGSDSEYEITTVGGVTTVRDLVAGRDGTDVLTDVEDLLFRADGEVSVALVPENIAPEVTDLSVSGNEDQDVVILRSTLLALASDANGDALTIEGVVSSPDGRTWLDLNGNVRFRGNANFNGETYFDFVVGDGNGGHTSGRINVSLVPANDAPAVAISLSEIYIDEDQAINIGIPPETFTDIDGDALTLLATLANGDPLPAWLSMVDWTIVGTPPANFNGALNITVSASDGAASVSSSFALNILPRNDAPIVVGQIADMAVVPSTPITIVIPDGLFEDADGDAVTLTVTLANGQPLPSWLTFDGQGLTGIVPADFNETIRLQLSASDGSSAASLQFDLTPAAGYNQIDGTPGNDQLLGTASADHIYGYEGDDNIRPGAGADLIDGGSHSYTDRVIYDNATAGVGLSLLTGGFSGDAAGDQYTGIETAIGSAFADTLEGDNLANFLFGEGGDDIIRGLDGNDDLRGGSGADTLYGGAGNDVIFNEHYDAAADIIYGEAGNDFLQVGIGDVAYGGDDDDQTNILGNQSSVHGGSGSDSFNVMANNLAGLQIDGGEGWDYLTISMGRDVTVDAIEGLEWISILPDGTNNSVITFDGLVLNLSAATFSGPLNIVAGTNSGVTITGPSDSRYQNASDILRITGADGNDILTGSNFHDQLSGGNGGDHLSGLSGNDEITGGAGDDVVQGGQGDDIFVLSGLRANYTFSISVGVVTITDNAANTDGDDGTDQLAGVEFLKFKDGEIFNLTPYLGTHIVNGTSGADSLTGTIGTDHIFGFEGDDNIRPGAGADLVDGGSHSYTDRVIYDNATAGVGLSLLTGGFAGDAAGDQYTGIETVIGSAFADTLEGDELANSLFGENGDDILRGLGGNDDVRGSGGSDALYGGDGNDVMMGDRSDNAADVIWGEDGNDLLQGGIGDQLRGGEGDDQIALYGNNILALGENGQDQLSIMTNNISGLQIDGGSGWDVLNISTGRDIRVQSIAGLEVVSTASNPSNTATITVDGVSLDLSGASFSGNLDLAAGTNADTMISGPASSTYGYSGDALRIFGAGGNDILTGSALADKIQAGAGNDQLSGLGGNDELTGGSGNDAISGGAGTDVAILSGQSSEYSVVTSNGSLSVNDNYPNNNGDDGTDQLSGIETLRFTDGDIGITSPIILDLDGNGVKTVSAANSNARYDLDGDGLADDTSWFGNTEGLLFLDRDGNGTVTNAGEFSFIDDVVGAKSDLEGLRALDSNKDGLLSSLDVRFADFKVWQDRDGDGAAEDGEILSLTTAGVRSIKLTGTAVNATTQLGEVAVINKGSYIRTNGTTMEFLDAALTYFSSATNLPMVAVQAQTLGRKDSKYLISFAGGAMTMAPKGSNGQIDPRAGALAASNLMTFKNKSVGLLSPIILDLDGDGIEMRSIKKSKAAFDMNGDGIADDTGWTGKGDGFLVIDRNNDGQITHASELSFAAENKDAKSDLEALAALDSNGDRIIDAQDARFKELKVWTDTDGDGITDAGELKTLGELGITSIGLLGRNLEGTAKVGDNVLISTSTFTRSNGSTGTVGNAALAYTPGKVSASIDGIGGGDRSRFVLPQRLVSENSDISPSDDMDAADVGLQGNSLTATEQAAAILRGARSGGGLIVPQLGMLENDRDIVNIFDYYEQPDKLTTADATIGKVASSLRLDDLVDAPLYSQDRPTTVDTTGFEDILLASQGSLDPSVRVLALIAQDMAAFGARSGENDLSWRRDGVKPVEFFA